MKAISEMQKIREKRKIILVMTVMPTLLMFLVCFFRRERKREMIRVMRRREKMKLV